MKHTSVERPDRCQVEGCDKKATRIVPRFGILTLNAPMWVCEDHFEKFHETIKKEFKKRVGAATRVKEAEERWEEWVQNMTKEKEEK